MKRTVAVIALLSSGAVARADSSVGKPAPSPMVTEGGANRDVIQVCEKYRQAMEARDAAALIALAHPRYHEDAGTPSPDDDYGYDALKSMLAARLAAVRGVRLKLTYRKVVIEGTRAHVEVQRDASFLMASRAGGERWVRSQESHLIELARESGRWLIIAGM